jgi:hypothetical protein
MNFDKKIFRILHNNGIFSKYFFQVINFFSWSRHWIWLFLQLIFIVQLTDKNVSKIMIFTQKKFWNFSSKSYFWRIWG